MEFLKNLFKDEDRVIGLCGFKKEEEVRVYIPRFDPSKNIYNLNCEKNFFLL